MIPNYVLLTVFRLVIIILITASMYGCGSGGSGTNSSLNGATINTSTSLTNQQVTAQVANNCLSITNFIPTIGAWWVSASFNIANSCATPQSASGLQLVLKANQVLNASNFSLNNISFSPWAGTTINTVAMAGNPNAIIVTLTTTGTIAPNSAIAGSFGYNPNGVTLSGLNFIINGGTSGQTTGNISYVLINPNSSLFTQANLPVTIKPSISGNSSTVLSLFGTLSTVTGLNTGGYTILIPGLASASGGSYYNYANKTVTVTANTTTAVGNISATAVAGAIADKIIVNGLASGESIGFVFTDSKGYVFNNEKLVATSSNPVTGTYKFLNGDVITVNVIMSNKYQSIPAFTITQSSSSQSFNLNLVQPSVVTSGQINFHFYYGASPDTPQDTMILTGDNYTDLIASNFIAGVFYGHMIQEYTPGIKFNKDYLYGSLFAQFLQENQSAQLYQQSTNLLNPSYLQSGVFGVGQGGPYQINNYAADMVNGTYAPAGFSLINYIAIQGNIGYTMSTAATQYAKPTPASFNNKYYGPILTAYFHFNDYKALQFIGGNSLTEVWSPNSYGWTPQWQPYLYNSLNTFKTLANSPLDILLNVAYNQGFYGPLFLKDVKLTENATPSTVLSMNAYSNAWGADTYGQYPFQVHNYLDQLYNNPTPSTSNLSQMVSYNNHVVFSMSLLATVFSNIFQTLGYLNSSGQYVYISAAQANSAFNSALVSAMLPPNAVLDLSNSADRVKIFTVLETAITQLETSLNTSFIATTNVQMATIPNL